MNGQSESDLIDHVQRCLYCKLGITFMPAEIAWWSVAANKKFRDDVIKARVYCEEGPEHKHRPDIDFAANSARHRAAIASKAVGVSMPPLDETLPRYT